MTIEYVRPLPRSLRGTDWSDDVARIGTALERQENLVATSMAAAVRAEVDCYRQDYSPCLDALIDSCRMNIGFLVRELIGDQSCDIGSASSIGEERARSGIPLHGVVAASRVASNEIWRALHSIIASQGDLAREAVLDAIERVGQANHVYVERFVLAHRQRTLLQAADDQAQHTALIEAIFLGVGSPGRSLWEIAEMLRIPRQGPFVVVAIQQSGPDELSSSDLVGRLRGIDIYSVWRRVPQFHVGIVCVPSSSVRARLLDALQRWAPSGAGVSQEFTDLREAPTAVHYARTVSVRATESDPVVIVGNGALEIVALIDPQISRRLAATVLGPFNELSSDEREMLHRTFTAYTTARGSIPEAAEALFCHPNTVRYRLQRIEHFTGRSVRAPGELAELCLAFEIAAKLPTPT